MRLAIIVTYASVTILDLVRGIIHTFLFQVGLDDISGLGTGDELCDGRLAALMVAYGGANIESLVVRSYIRYEYSRSGSRRDFVKISSIAAALWAPITAIVSYAGNIDVGDADVPGRYAMVIRSILSFVTLLLAYVE